MQKENLESQGVMNVENEAATSENSENSGESMLNSETKDATGEKESCAADSREEFEALIKGRYKEAFDQRVQSIINKRFKEQKMAEGQKEKQVNIVTLEENSNDQAVRQNAIPEQNSSEYNVRAAEIVAMGYKDFELSREMENPTFKALLNGGVDMLTAYQALHFDEIMDSSVRFGAETAAKQMADNIRFKVGRPSENGLYQRSGFGTRTGVSGLSPKQRRELAKKALMGEDVSF